MRATHRQTLLRLSLIVFVHPAKSRLCSPDAVGVFTLTGLTSLQTIASSVTPHQRLRLYAKPRRTRYLDSWILRLLSRKERVRETTPAWARFEYHNCFLRNAAVISRLHGALASTLLFALLLFLFSFLLGHWLFLRALSHTHLIHAY